MITLTDFVLNEYLNLNMKWLSENQKTLGELKIDVNFQYASIYQSVALGIPDYKVDNIVVRQFYLEAMIRDKKKLLDYLSNAYPITLKGYQNDLESFMLTDLCKNYYKAIKNQQTCNNTLYNAGLDTVIVYVGQKGESFNNELKSSNSVDSRKTIFASEGMKTLGT